MRRQPTRDEVKDPERLFRLLGDFASEISEMTAQMNRPAPPLPVTEPKRADSVLSGVGTPGGAQVAIGITEIGVRKHNLAGLAAPTGANDNSQGYDVGSVWINVNAAPKTIYMLAAATTTAAEWIQIG